LVVFVLQTLDGDVDDSSVVKTRERASKDAQSYSARSASRLDSWQVSVPCFPLLLVSSL